MLDSPSFLDIDKLKGSIFYNLYDKNEYQN